MVVVVVVVGGGAVIMLHFIRALSSFSTRSDLMRMAVRQSKHGAHLSAPLKPEKWWWWVGGVEWRERVCPQRTPQ